MTERSSVRGAGLCLPGTRRLVIMVKDPIAGHVKTRLGRDIGTMAATKFYRHTLCNVTSRLAVDPRWQTFLSVAPAHAIHSRMLPKLTRIAQPEGNIGQRMQSIFNWAAPGPIVVIGTDIPEAEPSHIARAFRTLGGSDVVFGPASDGGFWLIGMRRCPRKINAFERVRWSTCHTLSDCLTGLRAHRIALVDELSDADEASDMAVIGPVLGRRILPKDR